MRGTTSECSMLLPELPDDPLPAGRPDIELLALAHRRSRQIRQRRRMGALAASVVVATIVGVPVVLAAVPDKAEHVEVAGDVDRDDAVSDGDSGSGRQGDGRPDAGPDVSDPGGGGPD